MKALLSLIVVRNCLGLAAENCSHQNPNCLLSLGPGHCIDLTTTLDVVDKTVGGDSAEAGFVGFHLAKPYSGKRCWGKLRSEGSSLVRKLEVDQNYKSARNRTDTPSYCQKKSGMLQAESRQKAHKFEVTFYNLPRNQPM